MIAKIYLYLDNLWYNGPDEYSKYSVWHVLGLIVSKIERWFDL